MFPPQKAYFESVVCGIDHAGCLTVRGIRRAGQRVLWAQIAPPFRVLGFRWSGRRFFARYILPLTKALFAGDRYFARRFAALARGGGGFSRATFFCLRNSA